MNDEGSKAVRNLIAIFIATLFLYITGYGGCTAVRQRGGPWVVIQGKDPSGQPWMRIAQHRILGDRDVTLVFPGEMAPARFTNDPFQRVFNSPNTNSLPYGPIPFVDVTFFPGTVALDAFGHLIEMVPRTLFVNFREVAWGSETNMTLLPEGNPSPERLKVKNQQWNGR